MSIISRLFKIGEAKASKVIDGLEKPELMLEQAIRDKEKQIKEAKKSVQAGSCS
ncbi:MAG: PspA/IM30 family protein [Deltaproteobacteria bacterium]|nr:PspA/IM30 family protein [Deltaproteobacteria bacterium]